MTENLIRLYAPLDNGVARDKAPWDEIAELSIIFGYDFTALLQEIDDEWYFTPLPDLWNNLDLLPRINGNEHPLNSPEGFRFFYCLALGRTLPEHNVEWIEKAYQAHSEDRSLLVEAHRESNKTTCMELFMVFRIGLDPTGTNMLLRGSDATAKESGKTLARVITENAAFTTVFFPHVVPDVGGSPVEGRQGGTWNVGGYSVRDTRISDDEWAQLTAGRKGWSLMVFSPESGGIRGKRVSGTMLMDDLVVAKHVRSEAEMKHLITEVNRAVGKTRTAECLTMCLGTPQRAGDLLEVLLQTETYEYLWQPLVNADGTINWPARFSPEEVERRKKEDLESGKGFATEYQLDRSAIENREFEMWMTFPHGKLKIDLMYLIAAVDPATFDIKGGQHTQSHAAISVFGMDPASGIYVVVEGWVGQLDLQGLANKLVGMQRLRPNLAYVVIEQDGVGQELIEYLNRNHPDLLVMPVKTHGMSKEDRLAAYLKPRLTHGTLRISDGSDDYLQRVREALTMYPDINRRGPLQDILDSLGWVGHTIKNGAGSEYIHLPNEADNEENPYLLLAAMK